MSEKKRNYPLFMIDRSKPASHPFDYIDCHDKTVGFVARVVYFPQSDAYAEFVEAQKKLPYSDCVTLSMPFRRGGVVLVIEDFMYSFEFTRDNQSRIKHLMKKALKKYLHAELERTPVDDLGINAQIKQQQLTVERAEQNYPELLRRANGDRELSDYQIQLAKATLETLKQFKHNMEYFTQIMN